MPKKGHKTAKVRNISLIVCGNPILEYFLIFVNINKRKGVKNLNYYNVVVSLCESNNISLARLEKDLAIGNGTVGKWKGKDAKPTVKTLEKIAAYFDVPVSQIVKEGSEG